LLDTPAAVRFLSCEPLLGPVDLSAWLWEQMPDWECELIDVPPGTPCLLNKLHWVICGGESGPGARRMELNWAHHLVDQCQVGRVPVFVKQLGSAHGPHKGGDIDTWPPELRVREYPTVVAA
jgi:protein gp37